MDKLYKQLKDEIRQQVLKELNILDEVYAIKEASEKWNVHISTIQKIIKKGEKLIEGIDYKRSGASWLITKSAMIKLYGEIK